MSTVHIIPPTEDAQTLLASVQNVLRRVTSGDTILIVSKIPDAMTIICEAHLVFDLMTCPICGGDVSLVLLGADGIIVSPVLESYEA